MNKEEADLIIAEQNKSKEEILKAVAKVKSDYHELCKLKDIRIADLEKENAELKEENQKWKDEWQEQVQKATDEGYARTLQTVQLTKAKEIIKIFLKYEICTLNIKDELADNITKAKAFLKSEVEK